MEKEGLVRLGPLILRLVEDDTDKPRNEDDEADDKVNVDEKDEEQSPSISLREVDIETWCHSPNSSSSNEPAAMETDKDEDSTNTSFHNAETVLGQMTLLAAGTLYSTVPQTQTGEKKDQADTYLVVVVENDAGQIAIVILAEHEEEGKDGRKKKVVSCQHHHLLQDSKESNAQETHKTLVSICTSRSSNATPFEKKARSVLRFGCVWNDGSGTLLQVSHSHEKEPEERFRVTLMSSFEPKKDQENVNHNDYSGDWVVAMDLFPQSADYFGDMALTEHKQNTNQQDRGTDTTPPENEGACVVYNEYYEEDEGYGEEDDLDEVDAEDLELYGMTPSRSLSSTLPLVENDDDDETDKKGANQMDTRDTVTSMEVESKVDANALVTRSKEEIVCGTVEYLATCRMSGLIQIYKLSNHPDQTQPQLVWQAPGAAMGEPLLSPFYLEGMQQQEEVSNEVRVLEARFFSCGPAQEIPSVLSDGTCKVHYDGMRPFNFMVQTNKGDLHMYMATVPQRQRQQLPVEFARVSLDGIVTRASFEEGRHRAKLSRKGMLSKEDYALEQSEGDVVPATFRYNVLLPFNNISHQCGLFAIAARPLWIVAERGQPKALHHRMRHLAAGSPRPVKAFCPSLKTGGFLTVHERIGRVGSQRVTVFGGGSGPLPTGQSVLPGGGLFVRKIPLGVTVRQVAFIEDANVSSLGHPLFVMLISREVEADQSHLNDDGLTTEERERRKAEKEAEKTRRQVEADLGGFDVEQEWVEEIEREDYFEIDQHFGGAPPIPKEEHEVWLVDGCGDWVVLDRFALGEYEHGMTLLVASLTDEVMDDTGTGKPRIGEDAASEQLFISVGTGFVDQDGEDVSSKGRLLLFEVRKHKPHISKTEKFTASLKLTYEKDILLGPVTSIKCLKCEKKNRLVVGAGAELTVEQWGSGKLTQVGFFHANMHVQDIIIFRTFILLSDAYDSLHFLVWRESDKSLTLLAKDYEPTVVYAAGLLNRGSAMAFACHDDRQNFQFFQYAPKDGEARGGNKLVCRSDFHLGSQTVSLESHWCRSILVAGSSTVNSSLAALRQQDSVGRREDFQRFALHFGTSDGGYGAVVPVSEQVYWRLAALQSVMSNALESNCALSQRSWRLYRRTPRRGGCKSNDRRKGVLDGSLLQRYLEISFSQQEELASAIGSTVDLIIDNLLELECSSVVM